MRTEGRLLAAFVLALLAVGCVSKTMKSWEGHHISEVIQAWGPPSNVTTDGKGGKVYSWYSHRNLPSSTQGRTETSGDFHGTTSDNSYDAGRHFFVNDRGYIYAWRWKGL